jgi:hypothetical protein
LLKVSECWTTSCSLVSSPEALTAAICRLRAQESGLKKLIVRPNASVAGMGNATVDLMTLPPPGDPAEEAAAAQALKQMHFDHTSQTGIILHMFKNVGGSGQFGVTAVGDSHAQAESIYRRLETILEQEAEACLS